MNNESAQTVMAITKATAFRFTDQDLAVLDAIQNYAGLRTRTETIRMIMQHYVRAEGVRVEPKKTARRGTK
jgi:hypothetical protein